MMGEGVYCVDDVWVDDVVCGVVGVVCVVY